MVNRILNRYPLQVTRWTDTRLEGEVNAEQAGALFTSIPYDKGWSVAVDGVKQEPGKIFDTFLSVEIPQGRHTVSLSYEPVGLRLGFGISGGCAACLVLMILTDRRKRRHQKRKETIDNEALGRTFYKGRRSAGA